MKFLQTERLILRGWEYEDLEDLYEFAKDPRVWQLPGWEPHENKEVSFRALRYYIENDDRWAIVLKETEKVIGSLKIWPDGDHRKSNAKTISFVLSADYRGRGYMTEAVKRVIKYVFEEMNIEMLSVYHFPYNASAKRILEKCGFQPEATGGQKNESYDGQVLDTVCYSILKADYFSCLPCEDAGSSEK